MRPTKWGCACVGLCGSVATAAGSEVRPPESERVTEDDQEGEGGGDEEGGKGMKCPKCGHGEMSVSYHRDIGNCPYASQTLRSGEHLHYNCRCGYDCVGPTVDTLQTAPNTLHSQDGIKKSNESQ